MPNGRWLLDVVHEPARHFQTLNAFDGVTQKSLATIPDTSIPALRDARELTALIDQRSKPGIIVFDSATEFTCNVMLVWCEQNKMALRRAPGRSMQNNLHESVNGRIRDALLNEAPFFGLDDARAKLTGWVDNYHAQRPSILRWATTCCLCRQAHHHE